MPSLRPAALSLVVLLAACGSQQNDPYPLAERGSNTLYTAFIERPKHLDPAQSYSEDEAVFIANIYEPPLQYDYFRRPYTLIPATAQAVPVAAGYDAAGRPLAADAPAERVAYSDYEIRIRPGIRYQPHPAFALDSGGQALYTELDANTLKSVRELADFAHHASRELTADDYIYAIKRLAHPRLHSPIYSTMAQRIVGLAELGESLRAAEKTSSGDSWIDLDRHALAGVTRVDRYTYRIRVRGKYPQFLYWLAMPFFAPVPREVDRFYSQPGMRDRNLTLDWYPVGTGPYMLTENDPNARLVLERNPNFHGESYPCAGDDDDRAAGLLDDCGKALPLIERVVFTREKESIPYWSKFLQGYYDASGIASDSFDQAVRFDIGGGVQLSDEMRAHGIRLLTSVRPSNFYMGFNMLDPVVGGLTPAARKLRQALSIAVDQEEFISIFMNGRGIAAMSPLPPGIFGYQDGRAGINPVVYDWVDGRPQRKPIAVARQLLAEAGWRDGRNEQSGEPLRLYLDTTAGGMGDKSRLDWLTRQFAKLDIQLVVRSTDYNRFQEKLRKGAVQLFFFGWNADYPDPESFYFLLYGAEGKVAHQGENGANYANPEYDRLFAEMKTLDNGPLRQALITRMNRIVQDDAPWLFGFHPKSYTLRHSWIYNRKPSDFGRNGLKYQRLDVAERTRLRRQWNEPLLWPLAAAGALFAALLGAAALAYRRRESATAQLREKK